MSRRGTAEQPKSEHGLGPDGYAQIFPLTPGAVQRAHGMKTAAFHLGETLRHEDGGWQQSSLRFEHKTRD